ncbi:MAG: 2TM domain-containing protein [Burkholderiales bacterium]
MEQKDLYRIARRRVAAKFGFLIHLTVFVAVNLMLYLVNQRTTPELAWFPFPLGGWAIGLTIHGLAVMLSTSGLRERAIADELRKLEATPGAR